MYKPVHIVGMFEINLLNTNINNNLAAGMFPVSEELPMPSFNL